MSINVRGVKKLNMDYNNLKNWQIERIKIFKEILKRIGNNFILKGGTALFIYYGLDRFSEDIDLDSFSDTINIYNKIKDNKWSINLKKNTDVVYRVMLDYGDKNNFGNYPLKIEVSSRNKNLLKSKSLKYSNIDGVNVYDLVEILKMKLIAFGNRDKIRYFYDISFFLEKNPEYFSNEMLKELKIKMEYKDLDNLSFLLNKEFEKCEKFKDCEKFKNWKNNSIGTVHKFQGKEADSVILLGCDKNFERSVEWAENQPNILNVAATRAKYRFSIIGDIDL